MRLTKNFTNLDKVKLIFLVFFLLDKKFTEREIDGCIAVAPAAMQGVTACRACLALYIVRYTTG